MATFARDDDFDAIYSCLHRPWRNAYDASFGFWRVVYRIGRLCRKALEQTILNHRPRARVPFLAGLKNQHGSTVKIACFRKIARSADQHCCMSIVPAGMHEALLA